MLMVLDNCEHLLDASAELIVALLGACPALTLLTTSREPIGVAGEVSWRVPSLSLADEAIELFSDRARRTKPEFRVTADNAETVTEICRRLDGLPLAIELAAARVRALSPAEILDSLHDQFRLLTGGARTAVRRQQTLRASVDWSHALLTEPEQVLFRRLAVFLGGFDLDAAQAVAGDADVERYQVLDQLTLLVDKSLVVADDSRHGTRYRLLETVRQYAQEKLHESARRRRRTVPSPRPLHRDGRHARHTCRRRLRAAHRAGRRRNRQSASRFRLEPGTLGHRVGADVGVGRYNHSGCHGPIQEGLNWLSAALAERTTSADASAARVRASADKALLLSFYRLDRAAAKRPEQALATARELGDPALVARALTACGALANADREVADRASQRRRHCAGLGDSWSLAQTSSWTG